MVLRLPSEAFCADTGELVTFDPSRSYGYRWRHGDGLPCFHEITERPPAPVPVPIELGAVIWSTSRVDNRDQPIGGLVAELHTDVERPYAVVVDLGWPTVVTHRIHLDDVGPEGVERPDEWRMRVQSRKLAADYAKGSGPITDDDVAALRQSYGLAVRGRYGKAGE